MTITGKNTTVRPSEAGEGVFSTSRAVDKDGNSLYAYPLYLFQVPSGQTPLADGATLKTHNYDLPLPDDARNIQISVDSIPLDSDLTHKPLDDHHAFIWMTGAPHTLTITYDTNSATQQTVTLQLQFYAASGTFRAIGQDKPEPAKKPS